MSIMEVLMGYIDLHLHTTHSDGSLTPEEMVMRAKAAGVTTLAIADHDVITGSIEAAPICEREGIRLIPGVEIDTLTGNTLVHVLAYFPHGDSGKNAFENERFLSLITDSREKLDGMSTILIERLAQRNANVSVEEFRAFPEHKGDGGWKALYYLAHKGVVQKPKHALGLYEQMGVLYGNQDFASTEKAIEIIHACSGLAVMAHPLSTFGDPLEKKVLDALGAGFDGIECHYPKHDSKTTWLLRTICKRHGLFETAGSDDHGTFSGAPAGSLKISDLPCGW